MKQLINILFVFFMLTTYCCQKNTSEKINNSQTSNIHSMEVEILKKQVEYGASQYFNEAGVEMPKPEFSIDELNEVSIIAKDALKNGGYQEISDDDYKLKIKEIFNRSLEMSSNTNIVYLNFFDKCNKTLLRYPNNGSEYNGTYLIKNQKIITDFYYLPELIDYEKKYPQIYEWENTVSDTYKDKDGDIIKIEKWRNLENLKDKRYNNIQKIINRNKYLFNNNKGSFAWLQFNDEKFLETLVKIFGYAKDRSLLEWYIKRNGIEKYNGNLEEYLKAFYVKNCDNSFAIHNETFTYMDSNPEKYSREILTVLEDIRTERIKLENLTFEEKTKLIAYLLYFGEKHKEKTGLTFAFMGTFYEHSSEDLQKKYNDEFRKNNFYGLPNFEKLWNDAKTEGDGIGLDM